MTMLHALALAALLDTLPATAADPQAFVPSGWKVESRVDGDLNDDALPDVVLVLAQDNGPGAEGDEADQRALVVLQGAPNGFARLGVNEHLLQCVSCGGVRGSGSSPVVRLSKRVLTVAQSRGSREYEDTRYRFRLQERKGFVLVGLDKTTGDSGTGASKTVSTNFLTGDRVTVVTADQVDADGNPKPRPGKTTREKVRGLKLPRFEDVGI
jgi:hypothetical protein